jgi:hypothetical protein
MRQTSILAYESIKASGKLSEMRWKVYDFLFSNGPLTSRELDAKMATPGETRLSYHKRLSELESMGLVYEIEDRICPVTNHLVIVWDVTNAMKPGVLIKPMSKYTKLVRAIRELALSHPEGIPVGLVLALVENQASDKKG